jgi:hypothetical protein
MRHRTTTRLALGCSLVAFGVAPLAAARFSAAGAIPAAGGESSRGLRSRTAVEGPGHPTSGGTSSMRSRS